MTRGMTPSDMKLLSSNKVVGVNSSGCVAAGTHQLIVTRIQINWFKAERFHVQRDIAPYFTIDDIKVGNCSEFLNPQCVPADIFTVEMGPSGYLERGEKFDMPMVDHTQDILVSVTNRSPRACDFRGAFIGKEFYKP